MLEAGDAKPRRLGILAAALIRRDGVPEDLAAGRRGVQFGALRKVADDGDLGQRSRRCAAEGASNPRGGDGTTEKERRHFSLERMVEIEIVEVERNDLTLGVNKVDFFAWKSLIATAAERARQTRTNKAPT